MQTITNPINISELNYPLEKICDRNKCLFIDIETTGFTARNSNLYLIGCVYFKDNAFYATQFFADKYSDEEELLNEFFSFAKDFSFLIHFNGNNFDIPYILAKVKEHGLPYNFNDFTGIDLYKRVATLKSFLKLENCKQKTIESFLKIDREDRYSGGDLIGLYHQYVETHDEELKRLILLHNFEDLSGMPGILPILSVCDLFTDKLKVTKVSASHFKDVNGNDRSELLMTFDTPAPLPVPISYMYDGVYFAGAANQAMLRVPIAEEELKYYYANYKDYYYLPDEDVALHKSVASFVDKNHREKAKAQNCYTRKASRFLPEWDALITPFFKPDFSSKKLFFELTDERKTDRELFSAYASHLLEHMLKQ